MRPRRRTFTAEYKKRILEEADGCSASGTVGVLLRREGLFSSHLTEWRRQREQATIAGLAPKKRGRKQKVVDAMATASQSSSATSCGSRSACVRPRSSSTSKKKSRCSWVCR
ncbi:MAG: transposase [Holophagales bacterium]|nr:transposase [Holophagales bacterium]